MPTFSRKGLEMGPRLNGNSEASNEQRRQHYGLERMFRTGEKGILSVSVSYPQEVREYLIPINGLIVGKVNIRLTEIYRVFSVEGAEVKTKKLGEFCEIENVARTISKLYP